LGREKALGQRAVNDEGRVIGLRDPRFAPTHPRLIVGCVVPALERER